MSIKTDIITFNVKQRGRQFRGQDRNFDTVALAKLINSAAIQERVKNRDMLGYFGHWPRVKFGMNPTEGGLVAGKVVALEPAIVTTRLKALPDGTIEHQTEFLDTATGKLAARLYASRTGGFSSAIDTKRAGSQQLPVGFYGFDYVLEPNFTTNRGYALDGVADGEAAAVFDAVGEYSAMLDGVSRLFDSLQADYDRQAQALQRVCEEREELMSMLVKATGRTKPEVVLDSVRILTVGGGEGRFHEADQFLDAALVDVQAAQEPEPADPTKAMLTRRYGH